MRLMLCLVILSLCIPSVISESRSIKYDEAKDKTIVLPPELLIATYIEKYSKEYNVPARLLYNCAREETGYRGIFQEGYNPYQISSEKAVGPFQIMDICAEDVWGRKVPKDSLLYDVHLNTLTAVKYINKLKVHYKIKTWQQVFSVYNQGFKGKKEINSYAIRVTEGRKHANNSRLIKH